MVQISGKYQHLKNENLYEFLIANGAPEDQAERINKLNPILEIRFENNEISFTTDILNHTTTLILDQEIIENLPNNKVLKSFTKFHGDNLVISSKNDNGYSGTRVYQFTDTDLVLTLTRDNGISAKRYYKRL